MVVDAIKLAPKVDAIIFATGDGDFIPGVEYIQHMGCQVEAITFGRSASSALKAAVDDFIDLDEDPKQYLLGYRGSVHKNKRSGKATPKRANEREGKRELAEQVSKVVGTDTDYLL